MTTSNESGRTMLEMLGVLGIMGIIMYGAVSGINYGMSTYKINQIYNDVQEQIDAVTTLYSWSRSYPTGMTATACDNDVFSRGCNDDKTAGLHPYGEGILIKQEPDSGVTAGESFSLEYQNIPYDACLRLKEMEWGVIKLSAINGTECSSTGASCTCGTEDDNTMSFQPA